MVTATMMVVTKPRQAAATLQTSTAMLLASPYAAVLASGASTQLQASGRDLTVVEVLMLAAPILARNP